MKQFLADDDTVGQLKQLGYTDATENSTHVHSKPLLICDVDEVVLHLVTPFEKLLEERGFFLKSHSFQLTGNIFEARSGREASQEEVWDALAQLFDEQDKRQHIVDGVVTSLNQLSEAIDIVFLTNMPHAYRENRRVHLANHGLDFPLITNTRSKVPAIRTLKAHCRLAVGFIDDTPKNLNQVRESINEVHLFHFMANPKFRGLADEIDGVGFSTGDWSHAREKIHATLVENT